MAQLQALNPGFVDHNRAEDILRRLDRVPPTIEGNLQVWEHLKGLRTIYVPEEKRERNIHLLAPDDPDRNTFHITDELAFSNGRHRIRADIVLFINGLPVLIVETKAAHKVEGIAEALDQLRRYHRQGPELMALLQIQALIHLIHFYYGPTRSLSRKALFNCKDEAAGDYETLVRYFVQPRRLLRVITGYILFTRRDDELTKVILRPHQMRAARGIGRGVAHVILQGPSKAQEKGIAAAFGIRSVDVRFPAGDTTSRCHRLPHSPRSAIFYGSLSPDARST